MKFNKVRKTVAILLLFALFFSAFPMSVVANDKDETEETVTTEETLTAETNTGPADDRLESAQSGENNTAETSQEVQTQEAGIEPEMGQSVIGPDKDGLYSDTEGNQFYLVSNGTRAVIRIYKRYWGGVEFSGPGCSGDFPYLATTTGFTNQTDFGTTGEWVYCIQFNQSSADVDDSDSEDLSQSAYWNSLADYQKNGILLAASYGAQNGNGHNTIYDYMATQLIIWEYQLGWRRSATTTTSSYYNMITSGWSYIKNEYNRILSDIGKAEKEPTFNTYSHTFDQTGTNFDFEDSNGALSQGAWEIVNTPSELSASIVGNKLRVSANSYFTGTKTVTLKRDIPGSAKSAFVYKTGSQHAITGTDNTTVTITVSMDQGKPVTFQKVSSGSDSAMACIANNPLYSLAGAEYKVYTYKDGVYTDANDPLVTNSEGKATCKNKYQVNTVLYVEETKAPKGYKLTQGKIGPFKITANGTNTFTVEDDPVFDPQAIKLTKTGTSQQKIPGAIFKAEFFASTSPNGTAQRYWYFASDSDGYVYFDDTHKQLAANAGFSTEYELFKPDGAIQFPLGCIRVTEVKAASGYVLPAGNTASALIKITQPTSGGDAVATWDVSGNNIYSITNNAVTAVNEEAYGAPFEVVKTDESNVPLEGAIFKVCYYNTDGTVSSGQSPNRTWYFKTDSNGYFTLDATHRLNNSDYQSDTLFATGKIPLGIMAVTEVKAPTGFVKANFTGLWRMKLSDDKTAVECFWAASNGYTPTTSYGDVAYVLDTEPDKLYVKNTSIPRTPISIKKTSNATASELACIQGNPLYSLAGAKYQIYEGTYPNGTLRETLTTDANGNATGTVTYYADGTVKLYAIETVAPAGYLLNSTPVALTVTTSNHVFNVSDVPTFDTNALKIKKTGSANEKIQGAVFKATFYASNWMDSTQRKRTWYFQSDENGIVKFDDTHLLSSYNGETSSALYKPNGSTAKFPLGCVYVEEVEAANGYILPTGGTGGVCIFIRQGGTKVIQNGKPAGAYWGDGAADPLSTTNPKGIYKIENDAQNQTVTAVNENAYGAPFKVVKTDESDVKLEGAVFKVEYYNSSWCNPDTLEKTWYFKTDSNGYFTLDAVHLLTTTAYPSDTLFPDGKIPLGIMSVREVKAPTGFLMTNTTGYWRMRRASNQIDVECLWVTADGYTPALGYGSLAYILDEEPDKLYVKNKPLELKIVKTSTDGKVNDIDFVVDIKNDANEWDNIGTFRTGTDGKIDVPKQYLIQGRTYRITEIVPENYICTTQNPQIVTLNQATTTVNFTNKPFSGLEIIKTSPDGNIEGIEFVVEKQVSSGFNTAWEILDPKNETGTYITDGKGRIIIDNPAILVTGMTLRITEHVPDGYICTSENPKTITLGIGKNTVEFENIPVAKLSLVKRSDDGHVDGIQFKLEKKRPSEHSSTGLVVKERWDLLGTYTTHDGGIILPEEFGALDYDGIYRVTEIVPQGYICENPVQIFTAGIDSEGNPVTEHQVTFENRRIYGNLEITKVDESYPDHKLTGAEFTVTMTTFGSSEQKAKIMTEVLDEQGNGTGVYRLEGIEYGTICEIRETAAPEGYELSDEVWRVTILEEKTYTITTPNFDAVINRQIEGQLSVHKEDADHNAMSGVQFLLEYSMDNGATWAPIQARTAEDPILPGYCTSEGLTDGILTTGADGNIVFTGLALSTEINSNVTYRLTEVKTQNGNTLMGISVFEGPLTIDEPELSYKVVNESVFTMPRTGSNGFVGTGIAIGLAILAALIILLNLPRGKKNKKEII